MKKILLPALAPLLASCGFRLKGTGVTSQPLPYQNWHVEGGAAVRKALENALRRADGHPVSETESQITLRVVDLQKRRDIYIIIRAATVNKYPLAMIVKAQAFRNGELVDEPMEVKVHRAMGYADNKILGRQEEEETIWFGVHINATSQIVRRLTSLKA